MTEKVTIDILANDKASGNIKKVTMNLRDMGEKIGNVGRSMSMFFTVPVVGFGMMILKTKEVQAALGPLRLALANLQNELGAAFAPIVVRLEPILIGLINNVVKLVEWFSKLSPVTQNIILGFVGLVAAAGPAVMMIGEVVKIAGTLQMLLGPAGLMTSLPAVITGIKGLGVAAYAAVGPWALLAAAVAGLIYTVITYGPQAWNTLNQIALLAGRIMFGDTAFLKAANIPDKRAAGGSVLSGRSYVVGENGPETFVSSQNGMILPHGSGAGGVNVYLTYAPTVSLASKLEAETKLAPYIKAALRKAGY